MWGAWRHVGPAAAGPDRGPDSAAAADAAGLCRVLRAAGRGGSECRLTPIHNITVAYKFHVGPYDETGQLFTESCSISPKLRSIAVYYDNPHTVPSEKCRCAVGSILSEGEESPSPELIQLYQRFGFKLFSFPAPSHVVTATFPYTTALSIWLAARRVHPALDTYIKERKLCAHPRLEIYQQDRIHFMCPLARQETSMCLR